MIKPYWTSSDGAIRVFHARCEDVIASVLPVREGARVHGRPPYGIDGETDRNDELVLRLIDIAGERGCDL